MHYRSSTFATTVSNVRNQISPGTVTFGYLRSSSARLRNRETSGARVSGESRGVPRTEWHERYDRSVGQIYVWSSFNRWNRIIRDHDRAKEAASTWNWVIRSHGLFQARGGFFPCRPCLPALHFFCTFCTGLAHSAPANRKILRSMEDSSAKPFLPSVVRTSGVVSGS